MVHIDGLHLERHVTQCRRVSMSWEAEVADITAVMVAVAYGMDHLKGEAVVDARYLCSLLLCSGHRKAWTRGNPSPHTQPG